MFEGIRGKSYHGDIAIDDVAVIPGPCSDAGKTFLRISFIYVQDLCISLYLLVAFIIGCSMLA